MKYVRYADLKARGIPWSRMHVDRLEKAGKFPKRIRLGDNTVAWLECEIEAWLATKVAERSAAKVAA